MNKIDYIVTGTKWKGNGKGEMLGRISTNVAINAAYPMELIK